MAWKLEGRRELHLREGFGLRFVGATTLQTRLICVLTEHLWWHKVTWRRDLKALILHPCSIWIGSNYWVSFLNFWFPTSFLLKLLLQAITLKLFEVSVVSTVLDSSSLRTLYFLLCEAYAFKSNFFLQLRDTWSKHSNSELQFGHKFHVWWVILIVWASCTLMTENGGIKSQTNSLELLKKLLGRQFYLVKLRGKKRNHQTPNFMT